MYLLQINNKHIFIVRNIFCKPQKNVPLPFNKYFLKIFKKCFLTFKKHFFNVRINVFLVEKKGTIPIILTFLKTFLKTFFK
jgi:hypothetical protein